MLSNPTVTKFCNESLRPAADDLVTSYKRSKILLSLFAAGGIQALLGADTTQVIADGSQTDGRNQITVADALAVVSAAQDVVNLCEQTGGTITTNPARALQLVKVSVNPRAL